MSLRSSEGWVGEGSHVVVSSHGSHNNVHMRRASLAEAARAETTATGTVTAASNTINTTLILRLFELVAPSCCLNCKLAQPPARSRGVYSSLLLQVVAIAAATSPPVPTATTTAIATAIATSSPVPAVTP